jgi:3-hydroxyisobutyrate dehydrogenase-like beta-hydroxyacid dehydrogenase
MSETVGFIGLGRMGKPMSINLIKKGFTVVVRDINPTPVDELIRLGASEGKNPREVAKESTIVITMLVDDAMVKEVIFGKDGVIESFGPNSVLVDMSTLTPNMGTLLAQEVKRKGGDFLSAPVTKGTQGAREGTLTIMVGGKKEIFERCLPIFEAMGKKIFHVGEKPEMGYVCKLINSCLTTVQTAAPAEAMALAVKAGADPGKIFDVISEGSGNSYMFQTRIADMLEGNREARTGPMTLMFKDLENIISYAKELRFPLVFPVITQQLYLEGIVAGLGHKEPSAIVELYERKHNISVVRKTEKKDE